MFVERTSYFARAGQTAQVLRTRRKASAIRVELGLPAGVIFVKHGDAGDGPDVSWECSYASIDGYEQDLATRAASGAYARVRLDMEVLLDNFERHLSSTDSTDPSLADYPIVPRRVEFRSGAERLVGYLYLPPGNGPFPCVITNHGSAIHQGTADLCRPGTASLLMSWGYASFLPHRHGYGESTGVPWDTEVNAKFGTDDYDRQLVTRLEREADDVVAAAEHLTAVPEIDNERIAVMGSSFGGTVTLWSATKSDLFTCAIDFAGAAINWDHTPKLRDSMVAATRAIRGPIFFLQAENDYSIGPTKVLGAISSDAGHPVESRVFPPHGLTADEGHYFERTGSLIWGPEVRAFLARWT